jgi:hypothetical protein
MKTILTAVLLFASSAFAQSVVLDPGPGTNYLATSCGGQTVNEYAAGFDAAGMPTAVVRVQTSCHGSGRAAKNHYYFTCARITFDWNGIKLSQELINAGGWIQGQAYVPCDVVIDPLATFDWLDADGNVVGTLITGGFPNGYRAALQ